MGINVTELFQFMSGVQFFGAWTAGVFFLRFWSKTRDRLFLLFGFAFWVLAAERLVLLLLPNPIYEDHSRVYLVRLAAYGIMIFAIWDKSRGEQKTST